MTKLEAEEAIRYLCHDWAGRYGLTATEKRKFIFGEFYIWLGDNYPGYLRFGTKPGMRLEVETWFGQELKLS